MINNILQLTDSQRWILGATAILTFLRNGAQDYFGGGVPVRHMLWAREQLKKNSVNTLDDLYRRFNQELGYIPKPLVMSKGLDGDGEIYVAFKSGALFPPDEDDDTYWIHRNKLGWKLMHTAHLASLAYVACMIKPDEAWTVACDCAEIIQSIFTSWDEVFLSAMSSMSIGDPDGERAKNALTAENGLWTLPWNTPIKNIPRPAEGRRIFSVSVNRQIEAITGETTYTFEDALALSEEGDCLLLAGGVYPGPWQINKCVEIYAPGANAICQASDEAAASVVIVDAVVLIRNLQIISPGGGARGQVAIGCLSGTLFLEQSTISSSGHGMSIAKPARTVLYRCLFDSCALNGLVVEGQLEASNSSFLSTQYHTVNLNHQAHAHIAFCLFKNSGAHLLSVENGSFARIMDSTFENSTQAGLVVTQDSTAEVTRGKFINSGYIALKAKRSFLLACQFEGGSSYVQAQEQQAVFSEVTDVAILDCSFTKAIRHAVHLDQVQKLRIENTSFVGGNGSGLILSNNLSDVELTMKNSIINTLQGEMAMMVNQGQLILTNCTIDGGVETCLLVTEKSQLTLRACTIKHAPKTALLIRDGSVVNALNCHFTNIQGTAVAIMQATANFNQCHWLDVQGIGVSVTGISMVNLNQPQFEKIQQKTMLLSGPCIVTAVDLRITNSAFDILSIEDNAYCTLQSAEFDQSKRISISIKNATLAHSMTGAISRNEIQIHSENGHCVALGN